MSTGLIQGISQNKVSEISAEKPATNVSTKNRGSIVFTGVPVDAIRLVWLALEPMLREAIDEDETTSEMLLRLYKQDAQLWCVFEDGTPIAGIVTEIVFDANQRKICNIWATAGRDMHKWFNHLVTIEDWAAENGCAAIGIEHARPGWKRLMKGYKVTHVSLEKEL